MNIKDIHVWHKPFQMVIMTKRMYNKYCSGGSTDYKEMVAELNNRVQLCEVSKEDIETIKTIVEFEASLQVNQEGSLVLLRYGEACWNKDFFNWHEGIYRDCRSCVIDLEEEELVIASFEKFFNMNEREETLEKVVRKLLSDPENYLESSGKLDGSLQQHRWYRGEHILTGSQALSELTSWRVDEGKKLLTPAMHDLAYYNSRWAFFYELIHIRDIHVVHYPESMNGLYLIGARNVDTGETMNYNDLARMASVYKVPCTSVEKLTVDEMLELVQTADGSLIEGWVLNICDKHGNILLKVKLKTDEYCALHRSLDTKASPNCSLQAFANGTFDDFYAKVQPPVKLLADRYLVDILEHTILTDKLVEHYVGAMPKNIGQFEQMLYCNDLPKVIKERVRHVILGKELTSPLINRFGAHISFTKMLEKTEKMKELCVVKDRC